MTILDVLHFIFDTIMWVLLILTVLFGAVVVVATTGRAAGK